MYLCYRPDAELYDYLRAEVGERMVDRMFDVTKEYKIIAELGCNRGFITRHELPEGIERYYLCDSSEVALKQAKDAVKPDVYRVETIHMDEEAPKVSFSISHKIHNKNRLMFHEKVCRELFRYGGIEFELTLGQRFARMF